MDTTNQEPKAEGVGQAPAFQLVVVPLDTASESLAQMRAAGYVPIITDSPEGVKVLMSGNAIIGDDLLMSALHGLMSAHTQTALLMKSKAMEELHRRLKARE